MSNGIQKRENEHNSIIMLAAQRELYTEAKKLCNVDVVISVGLPILLAIMQSTYEEKNWIIPFISALIIASIILGIILTNIVKKKKEVAATIQQMFDVYVFQLPWDSKLFGQYNSLSNEIIIYSNKIIRNTSDEMQFVNWYTPIADQLPLLEGITVCQAENCQWDKALRMRY